jgi:phosphoribosylanthranilate isomerase
MLTRPTKPIIKVCGLTRPQDAAMAAILGADYCGFIFHPQSPRSVSPVSARRMPTPGAKRVGVFVDHSAEDILRIREVACLDLVQLHGDQGLELAWSLRPEEIIKVFWPERQPPEELHKLMDLWKDLAGLFLFDSGASGGGQGRPIRGRLPVSPNPYLLAGGMDAEAARSFWPPGDPMLAGFDFNSRLEEAPGLKDPRRLKDLLPWSWNASAGDPEAPGEVRAQSGKSVMKCGAPC